MIDLWLPPKPAVIRSASDLHKASFLPGHFPALMGAYAAPSLAYVTQVVNAADQSVYTFTATSIGVSKHTRTVVLAVNTREATLTDAITASATIAGIAATQRSTSTSITGGGRTSVFIFTARVPAGTTGDIVVTFSRTVSRCGIGVWSAYDLASDTPTDTANSTSITIQTLSVNVAPGGIAIGTSMADGNPSFTWSGLTEDFETIVEGTIEHSGASILSRAGVAPLAVTCTLATPSLAAACSASFR